MYQLIAESCAHAESIYINARLTFMNVANSK